MTESKRKNGSVILSSGEKGRTKTRKSAPKRKLEKKMGRILIIGVALVIVTIVWAILIAGKAGNNNCESLFWNELGNYVWAVAIVLVIEIVAVMLGVFLETNEKIEIQAILYWIIFVYLLFVVCLFFDFGVSAKVRGEVLEKKESEISEPNVNQNEENDTTIAVIPYDVDADPFMEKNTLEQYYGQSVEGKKESEVRAQILYNNLKNNKPKGNSSTNYNNLCEIADAEYKTYLHEQKRDKESIHEELFENRIGRLQQSLNNREKADKENETLANEAPLATGYKDMGDEYFRRGRQHDAIEVYEESAKWYMRAICHAAAESDMKGVKDCLKKYEELGEEVEKLADVSSDRKEKINNMIQSYKEFITLLGKGK